MKTFLKKLFFALAFVAATTQHASAAAMTDYGENKTIDALLRAQAIGTPATWYIALFTDHLHRRRTGHRGVDVRHCIRPPGGDCFARKLGRHAVFRHRRSHRAAPPARPATTTPSPGQHRPLHGEMCSRSDGWMPQRPETDGSALT